jgi:hypothetical protein
MAHAWVLLLTPVYWFLLSLAAWRALIQLLYNPQYWEKTEHGLAKTSRISKKKSRRGERAGAAQSPVTIMTTAGDLPMKPSRQR